MSPPFSRIVLTAGVSGLSTSNQFRSWLAEENLVDFPGPGPQPAVPDDAGAALERLDRAILRGLPEVRDPQKVGAEYSGVRALRQARRLTGHAQAVVLHTDTFAGTLAARMVAALLARDFDLAVDLRRFPFEVSDRRRLRTCLGTYMQTIADALREGNPAYACFMPLGGYKVTTSLGYLVGAYLGYPTLYTHEEHQILHEIPPVPVRVDPDQLAPLAPVIRSLLEPRFLNEGERQRTEPHAWLFDVEEADGQELWSVSSFGRFLMAQPEFARLFAPAVYGSKAVAEALAGGNRGFVSKEIGGLARKLAGGSEDPDLQHEAEWVHKLTAHEGRHLYKGASNAGVFRCLYRFDHDSNQLDVLHVWTDHGDYEKEVDAVWSKTISAPYRLAVD
ncbi:MAG: hypothetical protein SNJ61_11355 [Fimbriimonadaceae bacterium]